MSRRRAPSPLAAGAMPLGIPPVFLIDALQRERMRSVDSPPAVHALLAEYVDARGFSFAWGQLIESDGAPFRTWRIVPVALWECRGQGREVLPPDIPERLKSLAPLVRATVAPRLPEGVRLAGLQAEGRRHRYALLTLMLIDPDANDRARAWLLHRLIPKLLPELLARCDAAVRDGTVERVE